MSILRRPATQPLGLRWGFETTSKHWRLQSEQMDNARSCHCGFAGPHTGLPPIYWPYGTLVWKQPAGWKLSGKLYRNVKVRLKYDVAESTIALGGIEPYLTEHLIKEDADYRTAEYIATEIEKHRLISWWIPKRSHPCQKKHTSRERAISILW